MRKFIVAMAVVAFLAEVFAATNTNQTRVACVGDSITFGSGIRDRKHNSYPAQLDRMLGENWDVRNFGVSGATLLRKGNKPYWKLNAYKKALKFNPDIVVIKLGTNDSKPANWKYKEQFVKDYIDLIESFHALKSKPRIFACYPVPAFPGRWGITEKVVKDEVIPRIAKAAKQTDTKIIDLHKALLGKKEMFPDTVHPNAKGATEIAETLAQAIAGDDCNLEN